MLFVARPSSHWQKHLTRLLFSLMICSLAMGPVACKGKKKLAEQQAAAALAEKNRVLDELQAILDTPVRNLDELEALEEKFGAIEGLNTDDNQILIKKRKVENYLQQERERLERELAEMEEPKSEADMQTVVTNRLADAFSYIANNGSSTGGKMRIEDALNLFASDQTPVLIIVSREGSLVDYDRPTTIRKYLNYLADTGNNANAIENIVFDATGKITELELIKR
jgi:hypothetical protein